MYNYICLIGKVENVEEISEEGDKKFYSMRLAIQKDFKNEETNEFDVDLVNVKVFKSCVPIDDYCCKGDIVGIKGRLSTKMVSFGRYGKISIPEIIGERVMLIKKAC